MTIRHVVLFKVRTDVDLDDLRLKKARALSESHQEHIDEIQSWWAGVNISHRGDAYDYMVMGTFTDSASLERYLSHPHHRAGVDLWRRLATWVVIDVDDESAKRLEP